MPITLNGTTGVTYPDGVLQGSGVPTASATSGAPLVSNGTIYTQSTAVAVAFGGTGATTLTGVLKGNGTSAFTAAVAGTDFVAPGGALGTPSSGTLTNCTGYSASNLASGTLPKARLPAGTVLQVISTFDNTQYVFNSGSTNQTTYYSISGLTASITPTSSTSKILLIGTCGVGQTNGSYNNFLRFYRNSTAIGIGNPTNYNAGATGVYRSNDPSAMGTIAMSFLDSPATTSAITYSIQICNSGGSSYPSYVNRPAGNNTGWEQTAGSNFILMEIAA